jgi:EmrB/QacA subfamily drug resistance transporter
MSASQPGSGAPAAGALLGSTSSETPPHDRHANFVLFVACLAQFMVILDVAVVNVAIPRMTGSLHLTPSGQQWVIDAYTLTFGGLLLLGGRLADHFGQRRIFLGGVWLFTIASVVCAVAQNQLTIELARGAQGVGGALMAPATLSLIMIAFTEPQKRAHAIGLWATVAASGGAAGVVLGGALTSAISWRWVFFINVPVGALIILITLSRIAVPPTAHPGRTLDLPGALLATLSLSLLVYAIIGVNSRGWGSGTTLALLAGAALALLVFLVVESRFARDPLLPLGLLADRQRFGGNAVFVIVGAIIFFLYFDVSLHLQRVNGDSPLKAGLSFLPLTLATTIAALNGRRILVQFGVRNQLVLGGLLEVAGYAWLSRIGVHTNFWTHIALPMIVIGIGVGLSLGPATAAATADVPAHQAGISSGIVNTSRQVGGAIGLAALSSIAGSGLGSHPTQQAIANGDRTALSICAGLAVLGIAFALLTKPLGRRNPTAARVSGLGR